MSNSRSRLVALVLASVLTVATLPLLAPAASAVAPVGSPTDLTPTDGDGVSGNPQLSWSLPADAVRSRVQISVSPSFSPLLYNEVTVNHTYTPVGELPTGTIYWQVAGLDAGSGQGPFAQSSFVKGLAAPAALAPADEATLNFPNDAPSFTWSPTPVAKSYILEVDDADDFIGATQYKTSNTGYTPINPLPSGALPGKQYFWRVRGASGTGGGGVLTSWSSTRSFRVTWTAKANMVLPASNQHVTDIEFTWDAVPGATAYNLQAAVDEVFTNPVALDAKNIHSNRYSFRNALPNAAYWWRVQAIDAKGNFGEWSTPRQFTREWLAPPTLQLPLSEASTVGNLRFQWSPVDHASSYELQFATDVNFSSPSNCGTVETSIYAGEYCGPPPSAGFWWRVRAVDAPNSGPPVIQGVWSTPRHQGAYTKSTVTPTSGPFTQGATALTPQSATFKATPTFSWQPVPGATDYRVYLALDPNFTTLVTTNAPYYATVLGSETAFTPPKELRDNDAGQSYYWYVRPCAATCGPDPVSAFPALPSNQFRKASVPVKLVGPADQATVAYAPRFEWEDYKVTTGAKPADPAPDTTDLEARSYQIQVSTVPSFATLVDDKTVDQTFFTPWDRTYPEGPLYWRVRAIDGSLNNLAWSEDIGTPARPRIFTLASPTPVQTGPGAGATVQGVPTMRWQPLPHSAAYEYEVYKNGDVNYSAANRVVLVITAHTEFTPMEALAPGQYTWRIRRRDADNRVGAWSDEAGEALQAARRFTIGTGTGPILQSPLDTKVVGDDVVFAWNGVARAATYRFQRSTSQNFATVSQKDTVMTSWAPPEKLAQGVWYWRVIALDAGGNVLTTSAVRRVTKDVLPGAPTGVAGYPGDTSATVAWIAPAPGGGSAVTGYVVTPYLGGVAQPATATNSPTPTNVVVTGLTNGQAYTFRVAAKINGGVGPQSAASGLVTPVAAAGVTKSAYVPITPCRVVDTRQGSGPLSNGAQRNYQVTGGGPAFLSQGGKAGGCFIPAGATAVQASITAVSPTNNGYLRAWPNGQAQPNATFLNYTKARSITNTGAIALATAGALDLSVQNYGASANYVIDIQGYFMAPAQIQGVTGTVYVPVAPCRVVDTRVKGGQFGPTTKRDYQIAGTGSGFVGQGGKANGCAIPDGAAAVEASVTAVVPSTDGYFRAWPVGEALPNATFLNFTKGQGITNTGAIKLAPTGTKDLSVQNYAAKADYVIDVQGYFVIPAAVPSGSVGSKFVAVTPCRVVDTRASVPLASNQQRSYQVGGSGAGFAQQGGKAGGCNIPDGAAAVEASVTAAEPSGTGFFRAWPSDQAAPNATFLNFTKAQNITNTGAVSLALVGTQDLKVQNYSPGSHYVIDVQGYYQP